MALLSCLVDFKASGHFYGLKDRNKGLSLTVINLQAFWPTGKVINTKTRPQDSCVKTLDSRVSF